MKAILYVGGALMVAAGIYGFIDYKKSNHDQDFRTLYENKKEAPAVVEKRESNTFKEGAGRVAEVQLESSLNANGQASKTTPSKASKKVSKKKRRITLDKYSRAPLDEKYLKKEVRTEPKKEEIKVEKKDL